MGGRRLPEQLTNKRDKSEWRTEQTPTSCLQRGAQLSRRRRRRRLLRAAATDPSHLTSERARVEISICHVMKSHSGSVVFHRQASLGGRDRGRRGVERKGRVVSLSSSKHARSGPTPPRTPSNILLSLITYARGVIGRPAPLFLLARGVGGLPLFTFRVATLSRPDLFLQPRRNLLGKGEVNNLWGSFRSARAWWHLSQTQACRATWVDVVIQVLVSKEAQGGHCRLLSQLRIALLTPAGWTWMAH